MKNLFVLLVLMVGISGCAGSIKTDYYSPEIEVEIIRYGIVKRSFEEPDGRYTNPEVIEKTDRVYLKQKELFGFIFRVNGPNDSKIKMERVFVYPTGGAADPENGKIYEQRFEWTAVVGRTYFAGYQFDYEWEMIPGKWAVQVWYENKKLAEKEFIVYGKGVLEARIIWD